MSTLLLFGLLAGSAQAFHTNTTHPYTLDTAYQPVSLHPETYWLLSDSEQSEDGESKGFIERKSQKYGQKYSHPAFTVSQRAAIVGGVAILGGGVAVVVGGTIMIVGVIPALVGDDTMITTGAVVAGVGAGVMGLGGITMTVGSIAAGVVLRKLGQDAPFTGLYIAVGGVATAVGSQFIPDASASETVANVGLLAVPVGVVTQLVTNRIHYKRYLDGLSLSPTFSADRVGAVAQFTF